MFYQQLILGNVFGIKYIKPPAPVALTVVQSKLGSDFVAIDLLFIVALTVCWILCLQS